MPIPPAEIFTKVKKSLDDEGIDSIDPRHLVINIVSLSIFPLLAKPLVKSILNFTEEDYNGFIETRKKELPDFIFKAILSR
jgi:hypothetical protein